MDDSIRPPSTAVEDIEVAKGSGVKAVTVGLLVSVGGGILVGALLWIIYVIVILVQETPKNEVIEALSNPWMIAAATLIGCLLSVLGGYLCARIARHSEYKFGLILSGIAVISGIFFGLEYSILWNVVWALTTWGSIMLGTQLGVSRNRTDLKGNFMSRSPWEHRPALLAPLTPEEEQEVLAKALKYKPRLIISRWIARVASAAFFVWFILGLFSVHLVVMFSLNSIPKLAMACALPHFLSIGFANVQRDKIAGFERLNRDNDIAILNRRVLAESMSLWLLHGVVGVVAIFSQL